MSGAQILQVADPWICLSWPSMLRNCMLLIAATNQKCMFQLQHSQKLHKKQLITAMQMISQSIASLIAESARDLVLPPPGVQGIGILKIKTSSEDHDSQGTNCILELIKCTKTASTLVFTWGSIRDQFLFTVRVFICKLPPLTTSESDICEDELAQVKTTITIRPDCQSSIFCELQRKLGKGLGTRLCMHYR